MNQFPTRKAAQAAAVLLKQAGGRMRYLKLLKLMYIADRVSLKEIMRPLIGGKHVAMKNGPLHSTACDLVRGVEVEPMWHDFVQTQDYDAVLVNDPGDSDLSEYEVDLLTRVAKEYRDVDEWDVVRLTHEFPEWRKAYPDPGANTSRQITLHDILDAIGLSHVARDILEAMQEESQERRDFRRLLACD